MADDPWRDDFLHRKPFADQLARVIETLAAPAVVSVSAGYGMGKTYFARRWVEMLKSHGKLAVYVNAWETDYAQDPLIAFIAALKAALGRDGLVANPKEPLRDRATKLGKVGAKIVAKGLIRAATFGAVGDKIESEVEAAISGSLDEIERLAEAQLEAFEQEKQERVAFKEELSRYRIALLEATARSGDAEPADEKLYIAIDELDRCRPSYALRFLEDVRHLFDAPGVVFVIFADEEALETNAACLLGIKDEGERYLKKFVDYSFRMPGPNTKKFAQLRMSNACRGIRWERPDFWPVFCNQFGEAVARTSLTLRQIESIVRHFEISVRSQPDRRFELSPALTLAATLREVEPIEYSRLSANEANYERIVSTLQIGPENTFMLAYALLLTKSMTGKVSGEVRDKAHKIAERLSFDYNIEGNLGPIVYSYLEGAELLAQG